MANQIAKNNFNFSVKDRVPSEESNPQLCSHWAERRYCKDVLIEYIKSFIIDIILMLTKFSVTKLICFCET